MFQITKDPSSWSLIPYLAKITSMILSCPLTWTWSVLWQHIVTVVLVCSSLYRKALHTLHSHVLRVRIYCHSTDHVHANGYDRTIIVKFN